MPCIYPSAYPAPPTQAIANSHIAEMMKLMFYGPLLRYNEMS